MRHDILADTFSVVKNAESMGKRVCRVPGSKVTQGVLEVMKRHEYIAGFEKKMETKGEFLEVALLGRINNCNIIKPNFSVKRDEMIKYEKRFLPAAGVGILIITTPKGIMDQEQARKHGLGGRLLGYVY